MSGGSKGQPGRLDSCSAGVNARRPLLIYGSRTFAHTVRDVAIDAGYVVAGLIDDWVTGPDIVGTLDSARRNFPTDTFGLAIGIGYNDLPARWHAFNRGRHAGWKMPALVHPQAYVSRSARIADACVVMAGAIVDRESTLGEAVVVWPGACINHDVTIGSNSFVSPSATLCGFARIGAHVFIGAGALIADHCEVADSSFIKMGARYAERLL